MPSPEAGQLSEIIHQNVAAFKEACEGIDEETASRAPSGRWSPKEIVSHLCGPDGTGMISTFSAFVEEDIPRLDIVVEDPFFSENRAQMTFDELLTELEKEYGRISEFVEGLSEEQLMRKAHVPFLKETPIGEYPTLAVWTRVIVEQHLVSHIDHMKAILKELGVAPESFDRRMDFEAQGVPPSAM
jgi:hypothetical protein